MCFALAICSLRDLIESLGVNFLFSVMREKEWPGKVRGQGVSAAKRKGMESKKNEYKCLPG